MFAIRPRIVRAALAALVFFALLAPSVAAQAVGEVLVKVKVSDTQGGNFRPILNPRDQLGRGIAAVGDINGDGVLDLAVGAHGADDGGSAGIDSQVGAVWILFMGADGRPVGSQKISATQGGFNGALDDGDEFGRAVGALGDLDVDGVPDIVVGATCDDDGGFNRGAAWILFMNSDGTVKSHQKISDTQGNFTGILDNEDEFGRGFALLDDWDNNGVRELAVAATLDDDGGENSGAFYVLFMNADGTVASHQKVSRSFGNLNAPINANDTFGMSIANIGDLDGDGVVDMVSTALGDDTGGVQTGAAWILFMNTNGTVKGFDKISASRGLVGALDRRDQFGFNSAGIGDHDGDGVVDILVGCALDDDGGGNEENSNRGAAYVIFMNPDGSVKSFAKISATAGNLMDNLGVQDWFGTGCAWLGDLDGDGFGDISVGARFDDDGGQNQGAIYNLLLQGGVGAAPAAEFTASPLSGNPDLIVTFQDQSTGQINRWNWDFGDGGTSVFPSPKHRYTTPGTYTVSLTVSGPAGTDAETKVSYVVVGAGAVVADFSADVTGGPAPLSVQFTDESLGSPTTFAWDFGDGGTSTLQNPSHLYTVPGLYTVSLTATGPGGMDTRVRTDYIDVLEPPPVPEFSADVVSGTVPFDVQFTDLSTGSVTGYAWDFGDGGSSTLSDPLHTYTTAGTYTVSLTTTGPGGMATETKVDFILASLPPPPVAEFSSDVMLGDFPLLVSFTNLSSGLADTFAWDFGDGGTSSEVSPMHTYTVAGTYTVSLTATGPGGMDTETKVDFVTVTTPAPVAEFSADTTAGDFPLQVNFTDLSSGVVTAYAWDFGDGGSSTLASPSYVYAGAGTFTVSLTVTGPGGMDTETKTDLILVSTPPPPVAEFTADVTSGDFPLDVAFTDLTTGDVSSYSWDFGDGGTSTEASPMYTYTAAGTYTVSLMATGPGGSDTETKLDLIVVSTPPAPVAEFSAAPTIGDFPLQVDFTNLTSGEASGYAWDFGDGGMSTEANPSHTYLAAGTFTVTLTATGPGGADVETKVDLIEVTTPPVPMAEFSANPLAGDFPLLVDFTDLSTGEISSYAWDFGDGGSSAEASPQHTYTTAGTYTVSLTATGPSGMDVETKLDFISVSTPPPPVAEFSADTLSGDFPLLVNFTDLSTGDVTSYAWDFGDGSMSTESSPSHTYTVAGTYTVSLTVTGPGGADLESKLDLITVTTPPPPVADFIADVLAGEFPLEVNFTDLSTGDVTSYAWDFGDGGTSTEASPTHTYLSAGSFTVSLTATGVGGPGLETKLDYIAVSTPPPPVADFSADTTSGVVPLQVSFTDLTTGQATSYAWDFGDGASSTEQHPVHTYLVAGTYTVSLTATGPGGADSEVKTDLISVLVPPPVADFSADVTSGPFPLLVSFSDLSTGDVGSYAWDFGDGGASTLQNPQHTYTAPGLYDVALTVTGAGGSDTNTMLGLIDVTGLPPVASFLAAPTAGSAPLEVTFTDTSSGSVDAWLWNFGDGGSSTLQNPVHAYAFPGTFTVSLSASGPGGSDAVTQLDLVRVDPIPPTLGNGEVIAHQKISAIEGGVTPLLDAGDQFGRSVVSVGDLDGDGVVDLAVGVQKDDDGGTLGAGSDVGALYILFMNTDGTTKALQKISATEGGFTGLLEDGDEFGRAVGALGDVDGDGIGDLIAGAALDDDGGTDRGAFYVLFLNADGTVKGFEKTSSASGVFSGVLQNGDEFGRSFAGLGDVDGDSIPDVAVGAPRDDEAGADAGAVYVVFLNADGSAKSQVKITEARSGFTGDLAPSDFFGFSIANIGDLSGDGLVDLGIGSTGADIAGNSTGALWLLGLEADGTVNGFEKVSAVRGLTGEIDPGDQLGYSVAGIEDLNADGIPDIAVGAALDDDGGPNRGAVYVLFMNLGGTVSSFQKISASQGNFAGSLDNNDQFGSSLGFVGDLDRDGYGDLFAGVRLDDDGANDAGAVFGLALQGTATPPSASFTAQPTLGVAPLLVDFQDTSTGSIASWLWDFGDGNTSTEASPDHTYTAPGLYSVTLTASGPAGVDMIVQSDLVEVLIPGPPTPDFSAVPTAGIAPLDVTFTDLSIGQVTLWSWDFGDGGVSTLQNPVHQYAVPGLYTVSLTASGPGGAAVEIETDLITVGEPAPVADFSGTPLLGTLPLDVSFSDLSAGSVDTWSWTFGDGGMSTLQEPSHVYNVAGTYEVSLTVLGPGGMDTETKTEYVTVLPPAPTAAFSANPTLGDAPLNVAFTNLSTGVATDFLWSFGDGGTSTESDPNHVYGLPGLYTVSLTATGPGGSTVATQTDLIEVTTPPAPVAEFSGTPTSGDAALSVTFTDLSSGAISGYSWSFGDGGSSSLSSPTYVYQVPGTYDVALTVTGPGGMDTETKLGFITVGVPPPPVASFTASPTSGPAALSVDFMDTSTGNVNAWSWSFGDGGSSTLQSPSHVYASPGVYTVTLTATGAGGSDADVQTDLITVTDPPPVANFVGDVLSGGEPLSVNFTDLTSGNVDTWMWQFGDGGASSLQNPSHEYATAGLYSVTLTASGPGGGHAVTKTNYVNVLPPAPVSNFTAGPTSGFSPLTVNFTDLSTGVVTDWAWDFGDGNSSTVQNPSHVYQNSGLYTVSLTSTGPGGSHLSTQVDLVSVAGCSGGTSTFTRVNNVRFRAGYTGGCNASAPCADIFIPDNPLPCTPTVLFVHGGGFNGGNKGGYASTGIALAQRGIYAVVPNYQLSNYDPCGGGSGQGSYPQAVVDVKEAVDWIHRVGTAQFGLPDTVVVSGTSAGGILAGVVGATQGPGEQFFDPDPQGDYGVDLVVMFSALSNFVRLGCEGNVWTSTCQTLCPGPDANCDFEAGCSFTGGYAAGYPCLADSDNCREIVGIERFIGESWPHQAMPTGVDCSSPSMLPMNSPTMPTGIGWYDGNPHFWISGEEPPFHIFHSLCDPLAPYQATQSFEARLQAHGVPVSLTLETPSTTCDIGCQHGGPKMYGAEGMAERIKDAILATF